jgi:hypothetical protein
MASSEHDKGEWAKTADEGIVPDELSGTDAPEDARGEDPEELGSAVTGRTTGSDEPATDAGIDLSAGDRADATTDGGQAVPEGAEPDLRDATAAAREAAKDNA